MWQFFTVIRICEHMRIYLQQMFTKTTTMSIRNTVGGGGEVHIKVD